MDKTALLNGLKICRPAIGESLIKGLESYHITGRHIAAFNGRLLLQTELEEDFPINGSIAGETFFKLVNELDKEIELSTSDSNLIVRAGRSRTTFPVENIDTSFLSDSEEDSRRGNLPTSILFAAGLKRCMASVGGKGIPQEEVGIHVFIDSPSTENPEVSSECRMYATNGITYSRFVFPLEQAMPISQVFLPASFCEQLINLYSELNAEPEEIAITQKYVRARFGQVLLRHSFYANPVSWEMRGQVDKGIDEVALAPLPEDILEAIKRCEIVAGNKPINFKCEDESAKLVLTAIGSKNQELVEELDMVYPFDVNLNLDLKGLRKIMESCKEIGFGQDYVCLVGKEDYYNIILTTRFTQ